MKTNNGLEEYVFKIAKILNAKKCIICSEGENLLKFIIIKVAEWKKCKKSI